MAKYNLIKNATFRTVTISGVTNRNLSALELSRLIDNNTTTSGVELGNLDVVCLEVDLGQRLKVDGIFLYANDLTKPNDIYFQSKNTTSDVFSTTATSVTSSYNATLNYPSAPRYIRCTISGLSINLYEFQVTNDDFEVAFGEDGTESSKWLENTPIGDYGKVEELHIYNNDNTNGKPATAYICIDCTGAGKDSYIQISDKKDGQFIGFGEDSVVGYDNLYFASGTFENTKYRVAERDVVLDDAGVGKYVQKSGGKLCTLPITNAAAYGVPFGLRSSSASVDVTNKKIYTVFYTGDTNMLLYVYDIVANTWTFISRLIHSESRSLYSSNALCYAAGYVYYIFPLDSNNRCNIYRYNLAGVSENFQKMRQTWHNTARLCCRLVTPDKIYMLTNSDLEIYTISSNSYNSSLNWPQILYATSGAVDYNVAENCSYIMTNNYDYVIRYRHTQSQTDLQYFNVKERITTQMYNLDMYFRDNKLYFFGNSLGNKTYIYDIHTDEVSYTTGKIVPNSNNYPTILMTDPIHTDDTYSLFVFNVEGDIPSLYGYNTGFDSGEYDSYYVTISGVGTYTTNILTAEDKFKTSYLVTDSETEPGVTNVSKDKTLQDGTIELRSSNTPPLPINEIYWTYMENNSKVILSKYDINTDTFTEGWVDVSESNATLESNPSALDFRRGRIFASVYRTWYNTCNMFIYDLDGATLYSKTINHANSGTLSTDLRMGHKAEVDFSGNVWYFLLDRTKLVHRKYDLSVILGETTVTDYYDHSASVNSDTCWCIDRHQSLVIKLASDCSYLVSKRLDSPYGVCCNLDEGCWVADQGNNENTVKRLDSAGYTIKTVALTDKPFRLATDGNNGCYVLQNESNTSFIHISESGLISREILGLSHFDLISGSKYGCTIYSTLLSKVKYFDYRTGSITWSRENTSYTTGTFMPNIFAYDVEAEALYINDMGKSLLPLSYDVLWQTELEWKEVDKDGYFLPNTKYNQARITLRNTDGKSTPRLKNIAMSKVITLTDIHPGSSKPIYVRSNVPATSDDPYFETRLRVWWHKEG